MFDFRSSQSARWVSFHLEWLCVCIVCSRLKVYPYFVYFRKPCQSYLLTQYCSFELNCYFRHKSSFVVICGHSPEFLTHLFNLFIPLRYHTDLNYCCFIVSLAIKTCNGHTFQVYNFCGKLLNIFTFICQTNIFIFDLKMFFFWKI